MSQHDWIHNMKWKSHSPEGMAVPCESSSRFLLVAQMLKAIYPDYIIEQKPYKMDSLRVHVVHSLRLVLVMGKP